MNPNEPLGYSNRSYSRLKLGDTKGAMKDINKSIELYPSNSYAYRNRALIYIEQEKFDKACEDLQTAIDKGYTLSYGEDVINLQKKHCRK
jgi:tetratricopeptide (TPR) repeat protein